MSEQNELEILLETGKLVPPVLRTMPGVHRLVPGSAAEGGRLWKNSALDLRSAGKEATVSFFNFSGGAAAGRGRRTGVCGDAGARCFEAGSGEETLFLS